MSDSPGLRRTRTALSALAMFILSLASPAAPAADQAGAVAGSPPQGIGAGLPLKRGEEGAIGTPAAALAAGGLLLLAGWVAVSLRRTRGRATPGAGLAQGPWLGRLLQPVRQSGSLRVLETAPLSPQARLHVVAWEGREYLISTSQGEVRVLDSRAPGDTGQCTGLADAGAGEGQ